MKVDQYLPAGSVTEGPSFAKWAESLGFDGLFTAETGHDPFLPIAAAAGHTTSLDYGTAIAVAFARSPMTVAYTAWDLAEATNGRFLLGLGTQVRAHIVRRFNMPWSSPGPRMREYIAALRAIWGSWQTGDPLAFEGDFYEFKLMTPFFSPQPMEHSQIPVYIAGVGEYMCRVAGEVADGFHVHPFHTLRYLNDVVVPEHGGGGRDRRAVGRRRHPGWERHRDHRTQRRGAGGHPGRRPGSRSRSMPRRRPIGESSICTGGTSVLSSPP